MNELKLSPCLLRKPRTLWRRLLLLGVLAALLSGGLAWSQRETLGLAARGYVFGYPLVLADLTRHDFVSDIAPANRLLHMPAFPDADYRVFVRPNVDTLYTQAWLDLDAGP